MSLPTVTTPEEWLAARKDLLAEEKAMTRVRDALVTKRRELPMVRIEKEYVFDGPGGKVTLDDLFDGLPAHRPALHVRPGMGRGLSELYGSRRRALARTDQAPPVT